ncbi:MAG: hypothetical protein QW486_05495 [Candidatus Bathyarchaeia archaeon]
MSYREMVGRIPRSMYKRLSERLIDALLESREGDKLPSYLAKSILFHWQRDTLESEDGISILIEALAKLEPSKAQSTLKEFGLMERAERTSSIKESPFTENEVFQ